MKTILILILITLIPTLELRASIPFGILEAKMPWWGVVLVCLATNIILGPLVYLFLDRVVNLLLRFEWLNRVYQRTVTKTQRRIQKSVDRYGEMGVALFIGIPLPGTGSYSGALGAYLLGVGYRKFIVANFIGVLMAGAIVTTVVLTGIEAFHLVVKISEPWSFGLSAGKEGAITLLESIALGIIQGITEFLPISSSGHLVLSQRLLGLREPHVLFDIALHGGTLMAVILVFWGDIAAIFRTLFDWLKGRIRGESYPLIRRQPHGPLAIWIGVATVPTGLIGLALADRVELLFTSSAVVGGGLLVTGTILWSTFYLKNSERRAADMGVWDAVWVGVAQGIAVIPGISRSGTTVSTSLFRGLEREFAARFSFLLMIPATVLALALQLTSPQGGEGIPLTVVFIGTLVAFLSGYASLRLLVGIIRRGKFYRFAYYCWGLGGMSLILSLTG